MTESYGTISSFKTFLESLYGAGVKKIWSGTYEEWEALADDERAKYDIACVEEEQ